MALSYSHSEWFVPSLQDLRDPEGSSTRRCVWHKSRRTPKSDGAHLVRCLNPIGQQDARRADQLLEDLRKAPDGGKDCLSILRELSSLSLCSGVHRSANAETIYNFWSSESKASTPAPEAPRPTPKLPTPKPPVLRITSTEVLEQLGITTGIRTPCHGRQQRGGGCGNWINKGNGERITSIARVLAEDLSLSSTALKLLEELSGLVMCLRWHQDQAPLKLKDWTTLIKSKEASANASQTNKVTAAPRTPPRQLSRYREIETPETNVSALWTSPRQSRSPESAATTPDSSPSLGRTTIRPPIENSLHQPVFGRLRDQSSPTTSPTSTRTRAAVRDSRNGPTTLASDSSAFEPLPTAKSPLEAARHVMEKIKEKISKAEFASGFVYGFRRPGCDLIKIGYTTKTAAERLRAIGRQCKYTPSLVFTVATNHAHKVEHLVHRQFYRQNRRESLINCLCNNGRGCPTKHKEWFEGVSDTYAEAAVRAWVSWISLEPYDNAGFLKETWVAQTKIFDLSAPGDIWMRWTKITLVKEVKKEVRDEALDSAIKTEKVLSVVSELSSQLVPPKSEVLVTTAEVRGGISALAAPASLSTPINVMA